MRVALPGRADGSAIELFDVRWLEEEPAGWRAFQALAGRLGIGLGWHYLLDLIWITRNLGPVPGLTILDAGAGLGVLQWWLAERGARVISVDRQDRSDLPGRFRLRYRVSGLRATDLKPLAAQVANRWGDASRGPGKRVAAIVRSLGSAGLVLLTPKAEGRIWLYRADLADLRDVESESVDAVVSLSALEHNPPDVLAQIVPELLRVLKPGGVLLATLAAAEGADWYHEPSRGWCYSEESLRRCFGLPHDVASNYGSYAEYFARLTASEVLRDNLPAHYFQSGDNGMPWGIWDPKYMPVGVRVTKPAAAAEGEAPPGAEVS